MDANKNYKISNTSILMILGVLLISISGVVFVSSSWKYFSQTVKVLILLGSSIAFFGASFIRIIKREVPLASNVFYYLGTLFLGLTTVMLFGGFISENNRIIESAKDAEEFEKIVYHNITVLVMLLVVILIPIVVKYYLNKFAGDILISVIILNVLAVFAPRLFNDFINEMLGGVILVLNGTVFLAVTVFKEKLFEGKLGFIEEQTGRFSNFDATKAVITVTFIIEFAINGILFFLADIIIREGFDLANAFLYLAFTIFCFVATLKNFKTEESYGLRYLGFYRVINSLSIISVCVACSSLMRCIVDYVKPETDYEFLSRLSFFVFVTMFLVFVAIFEARSKGFTINRSSIANFNDSEGNSVNVVHLKKVFKSKARKELMVLASILVLFNIFYEVITYEVDGGLFGNEEYNPDYFPTILISALFFAAVAYIRNYKKFYVPAIQLSITGIVSIIASLFDDYNGAFLFFGFASVLVVIASFSGDRNARSILHTIALTENAIALCMLTHISHKVEIFGETCETGVPVHVLIFVFTIFMLKFVWYDNKKTVPMIQFIGMAILQAYLLLYNFVEGDILSLLTLSVLAIVILIVSVARQDRKYVILSSVVIGITVINLTMDFWKSLAWWIYLFIGGVILVSYAVYREIKKKK